MFKTNIGCAIFAQNRANLLQMSDQYRIKRKIIIICFLFIAAISSGAFIGYNIWQRLFLPNTAFSEKEKSIYIHTGWEFKDVAKALTDSSLIKNTEWFEWTAEKMKYTNVKPGRYVLNNGMDNKNIVELLRAGKQTPVKVVFHNIRTPEQLSGIISAQIEADSLSILSVLKDSVLLAGYSLTPATVFTMIIPNTYEFYWNTSANGFIERMYKEYETFWNEDREQKRKNLEMSRIEVSALASIIEEETQQNAEKPRMAGTYLNRLRIGMPLQADPTIKFALGDFSLRRILFEHLEVVSPYNTYMHAGLTPGPICMPSIASIQSVLNAEKNNYLYFCAKEDFSGYHNFARTLAEHSRNARIYQAALNKAAIY